MSLQEAKRLREERGELAKQMTTLAQEVAKRGDGFTAEETAKFDAMEADCRQMKETYEKLETAHEFSAELADMQEERHVTDYSARTDVAEKKTSHQDYEFALRAWMIRQQNKHATIRQEFLDAEKKLGADNIFADGACPWADEKDTTLKLYRRTPSLEELRKQSQEITYRATTAQTVTTTGGGHTAHSELIRRLEIQMLAFGGMRNVSRIVRSDHGNAMLFPLVDDVGEVANIVAINSAASVQSLTFGQKSISVFKYSSGIVLVPMELLQDTAVDLIAYIGDALGRRVAAGTNAHFTTASTTAGKPVGVRSRAPTGATTTATSGALSYGKMMDMKHSVDPAYRTNATWMMHDNLFRDTMKLVDSNGNPIFNPAGPRTGDTDRLLDHPVQINQDMTSTTTGTTAQGDGSLMLFGDFNAYVIRDVQGIQLLRLDERYAELAQTAWLTFSRHGGDTVFASTTTARNPIQALKNST